ncbi:hypothetical protein H920_06029 [Fukomys damarensis]|uniref:Uncharacterized protein n=1 Tax=Fukomys damarensis TaxID=885580 RepID=A0A091DPR1_FUKDA|nr:hypothetical protein H920_06029 [Fukomys damarensis]
MTPTDIVGTATHRPFVVLHLGVPSSRSFVNLRDRDLESRAGSKSLCGPPPPASGSWTLEVPEQAPSQQEVSPPKRGNFPARPCTMPQTGRLLSDTEQCQVLTPGTVEKDPMHWVAVVCFIGRLLAGAVPVSS